MQSPKQEREALATNERKFLDPDDEPEGEDDDDGPTRSQLDAFNDKHGTDY